MMKKIVLASAVIVLLTGCGVANSSNTEEALNNTETTTQEITTEQSTVQPIVVVNNVYNQYTQEKAQPENVPPAAVKNETVQQTIPAPKTSTPVNNNVANIQHTLNNIVGTELVVDGKYGPKTKAAICMLHQGEIGVAVDGKFGAKTKAGTVSLKDGSKGNDVLALQMALICNGYSCGEKGADGIFGADTKNAVMAFQKNSGLEADGVAGKKTFEKLLA